MPSLIGVAPLAQSESPRISPRLSQPSPVVSQAQEAPSPTRREDTWEVGSLSPKPLEVDLACGGAVAPPAGIFSRVPSIKRFDSTDAAKIYVASAREAMNAQAKERIKLHEPTSDQEFPCNIMVYDPPVPAMLPPLLIVGGMGPLAGLEAFEEALNRGDGSRGIVLHQATNTPDRTQALVSSSRDPSHGRENRLPVTRCIAEAIKHGHRIASPNRGRVVMMVSCNTAHAFVPEALERIDSQNLHWISFVEAAAKAAQAQSRPTLIAGTTGTQVAGLYTEAFTRNGVASLYPDAQGQEDLMKAIYEGIKGFDNEAALYFGERFVRAVMAVEPAVTQILAGCTEVPVLLELLKNQGPADVSAFLKGCIVLNPLHEAMVQLEARPVVSLDLA